MKNKIVSHKVKLKFDVGQKVYYKVAGKIKRTTINKIEISTVIKKNKTPVHATKYIGMAAHSRWSYYRSNRYFKEAELFTSEEAAKKGLIPTEKTKLAKLIKKVKQSITTNKKTIKLANKKLDEIKKEELIEQLSGI